MDPKRLEKLQEIQDWELAKPNEDPGWAEDVKRENLDVKYDNQLQEMLDTHSAKLLEVEKDLDRFTNWPEVARYELTQRFDRMFKDAGEPASLEGKTKTEWIDEEFDSQQLYYTWKVAKLNQSIERLAKEIELRVGGYLEVKEEVLKGTLPEGSKIRIPLGTTYYIDPTNGTDTFAGTRIDSTVDTTALETAFVDDALTGADNYILSSYFFNVTRGLGSLITGFVAATDTVTLGTAITGMAAGDTYYILNSWIDLDQFTENARSAGDKVIIRRGAVQCDDGTDLTFTSDGSRVAPIVIEADFDNLWRDQVDLSATATATLTFGSKTVTYSSDISSVLAAGDWIYASGDSNKVFAYEVESVSTVTATLYLPYKGAQAGAGKTTYNMQDNPIWNSAAGDFQWNMDTDHYWLVRGLNIRGTDVNGQVEIDSSFGTSFVDTIIQGNGANDVGIGLTDGYFDLTLEKVRIYNNASGITSESLAVYGFIKMNNVLLDGNSVTSSRGLTSANGVNYFDFFGSEMEIKNMASTGLLIAANTNSTGGKLRIRNIVLNSETIAGVASAPSGLTLAIEDYGGTVGDNRFLSSSLNTANTLGTDDILLSETTTVRSGGSTKSIKVVPTTSLGSVWTLSNLMVFEIPIYATTSSKQYDIYFRPSATGDWTNDPTASELWIELEAWGHASNNFRKITKSTGVIDMNGSTAWQALTVTVAPSQAGVAYLRCWYAKTKEAGSNVFYVDPVPVIT